jgi:hypothetical protein
MKAPFILERDKNNSKNEWHEKIRQILIEEVLGKRLILISWDPTKLSYGREFPHNYDIKIDGRKYLISDVPVVTDEMIDEISSEEDFYRDLLMGLLYNFSELENKDQLIKDVTQYFQRLDIDAPYPFKRGNVLFTAGDGEYLVIG